MAKAVAKVQPAPEPTLAERIRSVQAEAEGFIQSKVQELKAAHPTLPVGWLETGLATPNERRQCNCRCALNILGRRQWMTMTTSRAGILSFVLADTGEPWAEMRCLGWDVVEPDEAEDLIARV